MKSEAPAPIPIPLRQRWEDARLRGLPVVVFVSALVAIAVLWRGNVAAPSLVGQAEPVLASVSSHKPGVLAALHVARFQTVQAGEALGQVLIADPKLLEASLAVIRAELDMLRANLQPIVAQQRNAVDYAQLRLDWMRQRADLASAKVNLQLADAELRRTEELFKASIASPSALDIAQATRDALGKQVEELTQLVADGEQSFKNLQPSGVANLSQISDEPMRTAVAVQEAKLRLVETELSPITLRAPIEGMITTVFHRSGEAVVAGDPIVAVAAARPVRIVGYLRPPILSEPKAGMRVQIRTRRAPREAGAAQIMQVGAQLETIPPVMLGPMKLASVELGLPLNISLPPNLNLRPGELVDITLSLKPD